MTMMMLTIMVVVMLRAMSKTVMMVIIMVVIKVMSMVIKTNQVLKKGNKRLIIVDMPNPKARWRKPVP